MEKLVFLHRLALIALLALVAPFATGAGAAEANWPTRPVHLIVPFAAGGSTDLVARHIGSELAKRIGQPVVVENKAGAGGLIGSQFVAQQQPDGYTLLMGTVSTHAIAPSVFAKVPYDIIKDFTPLTMVGTIPDLIVVNPSVPVKNLAEFIALAKTKPGILTYGSGGKGTSSHLGSEYFAAEAGISLNHIPYKGSGPALVDVLAGHIDMMLDVVMTSLEPLKSGRLRALAITSKTRSPLLPEVPTVAESGIPGFEAIIWFGMFGPGNMSPDLQKRIAGHLDAILNQPEMKQFLLKQGIVAAGNGPGPFAQQIKGDIEKWHKVAEIAKIVPE
jgi:tripartite-type tricarboxylate transporter receptor subunit TctC